MKRLKIMLIILLTIIGYVIFMALKNQTSILKACLSNIIYLIIILVLETSIYLICNRKIYYLAYGSNISSTLLSKHCKKVKLINKGLLKNYRLNFKTMDGRRSFATIEKDDESSVPIVIYEISRKDLKTLDIYEELESKLYYKKIIKTKVNNKIYFSVVYLMNENSIEALPSEEYCDKLYLGYNEYEFNPGYILEAKYKIFKKNSKNP